MSKKCERCGMMEANHNPNPPYGNRIPGCDAYCPPTAPPALEDAKASAKEFLRQRTIARYGTESVMSGGGDWHIDIRDMARFAEQYAAKRLEREGVSAAPPASEDAKALECDLFRSYGSSSELDPTCDICDVPYSLHRSRYEEEYAEIRQRLEESIAWFRKDGEWLVDAVTEHIITEREQYAAKRLEAERERVVDREDAVFAKGYRRGFFDGSKGTTAFQSEVDDAWKFWVENGRKTHL